MLFMGQGLLVNMRGASYDLAESLPSLHLWKWQGWLQWLHGHREGRVTIRVFQALSSLCLCVPSDLQALWRMQKNLATVAPVLMSDVPPLNYTIQQSLKKKHCDSPSRETELE